MVGDEEGEVVGLVGLELCEGESLDVGDDVGDVVGKLDGDGVGDLEGLIDGNIVGEVEGEMMGL